MGNTELKATFKNVIKDQQSSSKLGLTPDILAEDDLVLSVLNYIKEKMKLENVEMEKAFPESNSQQNDNSEENYKRQFIATLNEGLVNGFVTSQGNLEMLKEPGKST